MQVLTHSDVHNQASFGASSLISSLNVSRCYKVQGHVSRLVHSLQLLSQHQANLVHVRKVVLLSELVQGTGSQPVRAIWEVSSLCFFNCVLGGLRALEVLTRMRDAM